MARLFETRTNRNRDYTNPLRNMTIPRLVGMLEAGERGEYSDLQWFYYFMERSDATLYSVIHRRQSALLACDWDIRMAEQGDQVLAQEQQEFLREAYDRVSNLRAAVAFLISAVFRGYSHLEKHYDRSGTIIALEPVEQWFWVREGMFGEWQYNQDARSGQRTGKAVQRSDFVIYETVAMDRLCCIPFFRKNTCELDWDAYLAVYGIPSIFFVAPVGASEDLKAKFQLVADDILADGRGVLPNGSDIKIVDGGSKKPPYIERIEYLDKQMVLAGTGGLLTMLAQSGSGTLAGNAHQDTFSQIAEADAAALSGVMQEQFDQPLLEAFYPGREKLAYFEFAKAPGRDANQVVQDVSGLVSAGFRLDPKEVSEKSGYKVAAAGKPEVRGPMSEVGAK